MKKFQLKKNDVLVKFLHPTDPSNYLHLPAADAKFWVPVNQVLQLLSIPTVNISGAHYTFPKHEFKDT